MLARNDERVDPLPQPRIRPSNGERRGDFRMRAAGKLDLLRRDLVAAAVDELLLASSDGHHAGIALACQIPGGEPAVAYRLQARLRPIPPRPGGARGLQPTHFPRGR